MRRRKLEQSGVSAIELLVVVAIILVIAAIVVPHLFDARKKATEASAVASIKAIQTAESIYQDNYPTKGYSPSLINLGSNGSTCETTSSTNACLLDPVLASGIKDGYIFDLLGDGKIPDESYTLTATPQSSASGECTFSSDQSGNIQSMSAKPAQGLSAGVSSGGSSCGSGN
jgi:type IV pilus assembly protein PilA